MANDSVISASFVQVSELLFETVHVGKEVLVQKESFKVLSMYLELTSSILKELSKQNIECSESLANALKILNREGEVAKQLALDCSKRNKVYLLINCRNIVKALERSTKEIGRALGLIPLASLDVSSGISSQISKLCKNMLDVEYRAAVAEEEIVDKLELGIQEQNADPSCAKNLLVRIAEALGISDDQSALENELEEFKRELDDTNRKDLEEDLPMERIIALLEKANATTSAGDKEKEYFEKRNSLGKQPLEPLQKFQCPLSHDIMEDPVETSSRHTFERSEIEKWFAEGNTNCPVTSIPVDTSVLQPNKALKRSIEEWKERNTIFAIVSIKPKLQLNEEQEQEVLQSLDNLQNFYMERELHREWVTIEGYIPVLIRLLGSKSREIRKRALAIVLILAKDGEENKGRIIKVANALESIVRSLARRNEESKLALQLLLVLSATRAARDLMGNVQGCILLLVTMLSSEDSQVIRDVNELLENLSFVDQNIIQMAKANYFKPLLKLLSSGVEDVKMLMARTLSEIELTDHNKLSIVKDGVLGQLLELLSQGDTEKRKVGVKALLHLSNLPQNGLQMVREGAAGPLFELLYSHSLLSPTLCEQVAETIMHLATSTATQEAAQEQVSLLGSEEEIFKLFSLISLTGPDIQINILKTFHAMCQSSSGFDIRLKLRQLSAVQVLVQLCEADSPTVRANALNLFLSLTEDGEDSTFLEHVSQRCVETLLRIIKSSNDVEEIAAAMGIIANLPKDAQMAQWLVDAEAVEIICNCLTDGNRDALYRRRATENAVGALCHFTVSTNQEWQKKIAEAGIIPVLVQLLISGTSLTKQYAAISLRQLSESSKSLSKPIKKRAVFLRCFSALELGCPAHQGLCTVESSFCIVKANAVEPLVKLLGEEDFGACEASLDALLTLLDDQGIEHGSKVLDEVKAIAPIIKLLSSQVPSLQGKSLKALEMIFRVNELNLKYGTSAHMALVDITQKKNSDMKSLAAKVLAQLGVLGKQSSYF
ncbi:hypothetical protein ACFX14_042225 [Malus domestica]